MSRPEFIEALEARRLLATFTATGGNDTIIIGINGSTTHVVVNGTDTTTGDLAIVINAGLGNDSVEVVGTRVGSDITVNAGGGNDSLTNTGADIDFTFRGRFQFKGEDGTDRVTVDNSNDSTTATTITIEDNGILKPGTFLFEYSAIENISYTDSNASNRIEYINLQNGDLTDPHIQGMTVNGNGGDDLIINHRTVTTSGFLPTSLATGVMSFTGGGGNDILVLDDSGNNLGARYDVTSSSFTYDTSFLDTTFGILLYTGFEEFDLAQSTSGDITTVRSKVAGTTMLIETQDGNDDVTVGVGSLTSNGFSDTKTTVFGGSGNDAIHFDDHLNTAGEFYAFDNFALTVGAGVFTYGGFETQTLAIASGALARFTPTNNLNINAISGQISSTTISGGANHVMLVNVGNGNLANVSGTLTLNLTPHPLSILSINDQSGTGTTSSYEVNNIQVLKTSTAQTINYSGVGVMTLNARDSSTVGDAINVKSTPAGMSLTVNANAGNDNIFFGNGNVDANVLGPLTINAGSGPDFLIINNGIDTTAESMTLNATSLIDNGLTYSFTGVESGLTVNLGPGGTNMVINGTPCQTNVNGDAGNDSFTVGGGDIDANLPATVGMGLFIDGRGGNDSVLINDINDTAPPVTHDKYFFQRPNGLDQLQRDADNLSFFITWDSIEGVALQASNVLNTIQVIDTHTPLRLNGNGGQDSVFVGDASVPVFVHTGLGDLDALTVNNDFVPGDAPVTVVIDQSDDVEFLHILSGGTVRVTTEATLVKTRASRPGGLTLAGVLDLAGGAFLSSDGGPTPEEFRAQIIAGRNGGAWNGTSPTGAINSSLAASTPISDGVGFGLGSEIGITTIGPFNIAAGDMLIRYALDGDTNLDGQVNVADLGALASNWQGSGKSYSQGDGNFDGLVDVADLGALASNWQQSLASPVAASAPVPRKQTSRLFEELIPSADTVTDTLARPTRGPAGRR